MSCTIHKVKHLFWYIVLVTAVVLIWSPQTMVTMMVASQHAPKNARENRQLRPSSSTSEEVNGDDQERMTSSVAQNVVQALDTQITAADENIQSLLHSVGLPEQADSLRHTTVDEYLQGHSNMLLKLTDRHGREKVDSIVAATKTTQLQKILPMYWNFLICRISLMKNVMRFFFKVLSLDKKPDLKKILAAEFTQNWIDKYASHHKDANPIEVLFTELSQHYEDRELAEQIAVLLNDDNVAVKETANALASVQMDTWSELYGNDSVDVVFALLMLKEEGINMLESPVWKVWLVFFFWREKIKVGTKQELSEVIVPKLRKDYFIDCDLYDRFKKAEDSVDPDVKLQAQEFIKTLKKIQEDELKKRAENKRKRQQDDGETSAATSIQRIDDGQ
ncbi:unnamed protein product [Peronospora farinosa]|uniref:RxLR effector candidate protein n=1 Tax=Peronospora farinosa TaxID=134698 RepID=A0ABN8C3T4_9STRA|nr:unnamed protein product [Peronospora farinosa]